ncbi:MAG: hypothetical protein HRF43_06665 [Phycisphaerae bacterium]|jgi:hypothetical protein
MPYADPDPTDPLTLHGVGVETEDALAMRRMAECFIEEYLRMGFEPGRVLHLFRTAGYAGPRLAFAALGEPAIRAMIDEQLRRRGRRSAADAPLERNHRSGIALPVLDS